MKPTLSSAGLRKEMLTFMPLRMVNAKPALKDEELQPVLSLKTLELSNLDQLFGDVYTSEALFYDVHGQRGSVDIVSILLGALEELLTHIPAAAGQLRFNETVGRLEVEYNSAPSPNIIDNFGVPFVAAHANIAFSELGDVSAPRPSLDLLYPSLLKESQGSSGNHRPYPIMAIQVTTFTCGGFTLALLLSHAFMDGQGTAVILQNLCSIARGEGLVCPLQETSSRRELIKPRTPLSPSTIAYPQIVTTAPMEKYGNATRFAFSAAALEALRLRASGQDKKCSRFQALVALLWTAQAKSLAVGGSHAPGQELPIRLPMNLREKVVPTLTRGYIGNAAIQCIVSATVEELCQSPLEFVVNKIKAAMASITPEYVQSQIDYIELQIRAGLRPRLDQSWVAMPSIVNLPFYETDCGWGRPVYCGPESKQPCRRLRVLRHPAAGVWNVLAVFNSDQERAPFQETIAEYTSNPYCLMSAL